MVSLATADTPRLLPSAAEIEFPPSPFSVHTMRKFARRCGLDEGLLHFVAGGDSLLEISGWHGSRELLSCYSFIFAMRPGVDIGQPSGFLPPKVAARVLDLRGTGLTTVRARLRMERGSGKPRVYLVDVGAPDISASRIRGLAASRRRIRHLVPEPVDTYIQKLRLYGER
jgi:nicotinate (nicotinamide) nucleotide adenylyltransferase